MNTNTNTAPLGSQPVGLLLTDPADPIPLRSRALDHFLAGRHPAAEAGYRDLLARRFQEASTCGHLARVLLMQDRVGDARSAIARAWKCLRREEGREETLPHTRPRLLFLRMLCAMLAGRGYDRLVARLKRELAAHPAQEPWSIEPVLEHVAAGLAPAARERLNAIAEAINDAARRHIEKINNAARRHFCGGAAGKIRGSTLQRPGNPDPPPRTMPGRGARGAAAIDRGPPIPMRVRSPGGRAALPVDRPRRAAYP